MHRLKWPVYRFIAVSFWNLGGCRDLEILDRYPLYPYSYQISRSSALIRQLYLERIGFLSLGFVFLIARYIRPEVEFNDKLMKFGFWALNIGLALMVLISLLPIGLIKRGQALHGLWFARSENLCNNHCYKTCVGFV